MSGPVIIGDARLYLGDCRDVLPTLPEASVHCVVTSPPYWGLRDYGIEPGVWGGEAACEHAWAETVTPPRHLDNGVNGSTLEGSKTTQAQTQRSAVITAFCRLCGAWRGCHGLEPTIDLYVQHEVEIFRAVKRVLRDDGTLWLNLGDSYSSGAMTGAKGPNSSTGHNRAQHEHAVAFVRRPTDGLKPKDLCMIPARVALALQADGWWLRSEIIWAKPNPMPESVRDRPTSSHEKIYLLTKSSRYYYDAEAVREPDAGHASGNGYARVDTKNIGYRLSYGGRGQEEQWLPGAGRNLRNVWTFATEPFPGAHFAVFPTELARRCILAGCPTGGTVLDPFGGSGTVCATAAKYDRAGIMIEANPIYLDMAAKRIEEAYRQPRLFPDTPPRPVQADLLAE